jgi:hypothetical protein
MEVVRALLDARANVNAKANDNGTALIEASIADHPDVLRALLSAGADCQRKDGRHGHGGFDGLRAWPPGGGAGVARRQSRSEREGLQRRHGADGRIGKRLLGNRASPA